MLTEIEQHVASLVLNFKRRMPRLWPTFVARNFARFDESIQNLVASEQAVFSYAVAARS